MVCCVKGACIQTHIILLNFNRIEKFFLLLSYQALFLKHICFKQVECAVFVKYSHMFVYLVLQYSYQKVYSVYSTCLSGNSRFTDVFLVYSQFCNSAVYDIAQSMGKDTLLHHTFCKCTLSGGISFHFPYSDWNIHSNLV